MSGIYGAAIWGIVESNHRVCMSLIMRVMINDDFRSSSGPKGMFGSSGCLCTYGKEIKGNMNPTKLATIYAFNLVHLFQVSSYGEMDIGPEIPECGGLGARNPSFGRMEACIEIPTFVSRGYGILEFFLVSCPVFLRLHLSKSVEAGSDLGACDPYRSIGAVIAHQHPDTALGRDKNAGKRRNEKVVVL
ncbi:hypothetical protein BX600DRAFT_430550 [Xylariales sp. PMI_506]|nr:hypothetical protein BX600DRAFT_430550 [Xylariales sp. PMI_506]